MDKKASRREILILAGGTIAGSWVKSSFPSGVFASNATTPIAPIAAYEISSGGHFGLYAENVSTGVTVSWRADERFVMCSTFKASLAACILARVDRGDEGLEKPIFYDSSDIKDWYAPVAKANIGKGMLTVRQMCQAAVEQSDNTCANLLLYRIGGPPAMTAFWRQIGDYVTRLDDSEPLLNQTSLGSTRNTTTPLAMARTLKRLALGCALSAASQAMLGDWLKGCQTGGNRLRAGLPSDWIIGDKTGNNAKDAAGDIAVVWPKPHEPIIICAYTRGGKPSPQQFEVAFAGIGQFIGERLAMVN